MGLDRDAEALGAPAESALGNRSLAVDRTCIAARLVHLAGIGIEVLDQTRRGVGVEVIDQRLVADVDLLLLEEGRHRNDDGELLEVALEVVGHRQDGAVAVADQGDLRGAVKELGVRLGHVEPAEPEGGGRREQQGEEEKPP